MRSLIDLKSILQQRRPVPFFLQGTRADTRAHGETEGSITPPANHSSSWILKSCSYSGFNGLHELILDESQVRGLHGTVWWTIFFAADWHRSKCFINRSITCSCWSWFIIIFLTSNCSFRKVLHSWTSSLDNSCTGLWLSVLIDWPVDWLISAFEHKFEAGYTFPILLFDCKIVFLSHMFNIGTKICFYHI